MSKTIISYEGCKHEERQQNGLWHTRPDGDVPLPITTSLLIYEQFQPDSNMEPFIFCVVTVRD